MADNKKSSPVWDHFTVKPDDASKYQCGMCDNVMSRGKANQAKTFPTSSMLSHLRSKHRQLYEEMQKRMEESKVASTSKGLSPAAPASGCVTVTQKSLLQPSLADTLELARVWDINSSSAVLIHRAIAKMIVTDIEQFHIVEKKGFTDMLIK